MSWSFSCVGKPDRVIAALDAFSAKLTGESKREFDEVLPAIKTIVGFSKDGPTSVPSAMIEFVGSGNATVDQKTGQVVCSNCQVSVQNKYLNLA